MVIPKFGFFQVEVESLRGHAPELCQPDFGDAPKAFDSVDMCAIFFGEFVLAVIHALVAVSDFDQALASRLN